MATNSVLNQGLAPQFVAAETLRTLVPVLQPLKEICVTDWSPYVANIGNVVHTRLAAPLTAQTYDPSVGFTEQSANAADIAVTLSTQTFVDIAFSDTESAAISPTMLKNVFIEPMVESVAKSIFDNLLALCTSANFTNAGYSGSLASFNRASGIVPIVTKLTQMNIPYQGRTLLLSPSGYAQLLADPQVAQFLSIGDNSVIRDGQSNEFSNGYFGKLHGLRCWEYSAFPTTGTAYTEGLNGIASAKQGLMSVIRVPNTITVGGGTQEIITDNGQDGEGGSGFSLAFRQYYNWQEGKLHFNANLIQGTAVGNPAALARVAFTS